MAKRKKEEHDFNVVAHRIVQEATDDDECLEVESETEGKHTPDYAELGRKGGLKGGKARAEKLSPEQRKEIAKKAAQARWSRQSS